MRAVSLCLWKDRGVLGSWDDGLSWECLQEVLSWGLAMGAKRVIQMGLPALKNLESLPQ